MWQNFGIYRTFWYLAFKIPKKTFFVNIEVCEEIVRFSHICENTKENLINLWYWFFWQEIVFSLLLVTYVFCIKLFAAFNLKLFNEKIWLIMLRFAYRLCKSKVNLDEELESNQTYWETNCEKLGDFFLYYVQMIMKAL